MRTHIRVTGLGILAVAGCLLAACSGGSSGGASAAPGQASGGSSMAGSSAGSSVAGSSVAGSSVVGSSAATTASPGATEAAGTGTVSDMSVRIANFYVTATSQAGPALDLYDVQLSGQPAKPILTNVAYGTFSAYAHPHLAPGDLTKVAYLEVLPTGEDPVADKADAVGVGALMDDGSHPQETIAITDALGGLREAGPLASLSDTTFLEKGDDGQGGKAPVAPNPPAGDGQLLASAAVMEDQNVRSDSWFLMIDDKCDEPLNHDPNSTGVPEIFAVSSPKYATSFALFPVTPATHQVSVVADSGNTQPTCAQLTPKQGEVSVQVSAGQNILAFVYGTSVTDLHVAIGPIQP